MPSPAITRTESSAETAGRPRRGTLLALLVNGGMTFSQGEQDMATAIWLVVWFIYHYSLHHTPELHLWNAWLIGLIAAAIVDLVAMRSRSRRGLFL